MPIIRTVPQALGLRLIRLPQRLPAPMSSPEVRLVQSSSESSPATCRP